MYIDELTSQFLEGYVGGEMEWQDRSQDFVCRGGIESVEVLRDNTLHIQLSWSARGVGNDNMTNKILNTGGWVEDSTLEYALPLTNEEGAPMVTITQRLDELRIISNQRIVVYLISRDGEKLDQTVIQRAT